MKDMNTLPDATPPYVFIIGAMKAGTTELFRMIAQHPSIVRCKRKEPCYFVSENVGAGSGTWHRGFHWYNSLFDSRKGIRCEASTRYTRFPNYLGVIDRIHRTVADPKFIYLVRNPVDRAVSQFVYSTLKGIETRPVKIALAPTSTSSYVTAGLYHLQLSMYFTRFQRERFHVVTSDDLWKAPERSLTDIYRFLDLPLWPVGPNFEPPANTVAQVVRRLIAGDFQVTTQQQRQILELWSSIPACEIRSSNELAAMLGFNASMRQELAKCFKEDLSSLRQIANCEIPEWS